MKIFVIVLQILSVLFTLIFISLLSKQAFSYIRRKKIIAASIENNEFDNSILSDDSYIKWLLRNGISFCIKLSKFIIQKSKHINDIFNKAVLLLSEKNIETSNVSLLSIFIFTASILFILFSFFFQSIFGGLAIIVCLCITFSMLVKTKIENRQTALRISIPDVIRSMSACFGAGYTIVQTFNQIVFESKGSLKSLFSRANHVIQTGGSISDSLEILKHNSDAPELTFLAVALEVQHQTGGSMRPVLESAKDMVENKLELMRMLQVQTAQAKLSARIVTILPFVLIALFCIISPGFLNPFFSSFLGIFILFIAFVMQAAGIILIRKMLDISL